MSDQNDNKNSKYDEKYEAAFAPAKRDRNIFIGMFVLYTPFMWLVDTLIVPLLKAFNSNAGKVKSLEESIMFLTFFAYFVAIIFYKASMHNSRCPRCNRRYFWSPYSFVCDHCDLRPKKFW